MTKLCNGFLRLEKWFFGLSAATLFLMMMMVSSNVFSRYLFNRPILGVIEFTEFFMVAAIYLGLAHTQRLKGHIDIELVTSRLHPRTKRVCDLIVYVWGFVFFAMIVWQGAAMALEAYEIEEVTLGTTEALVWPSKMLVPLCSLMMCGRLIIDFVETVKKMIEGEK